MANLQVAQEKAEEAANKRVEDAEHKPVHANSGRFCLDCVTDIKAAHAAELAQDEEFIIAAADALGLLPRSVEIVR